MFVAGIFHNYHKLYSPPPCSPPWHCFPPCLPAPAVVCPPDTGARTPESWWYLAATSPRPRPRWHLLRWRGQHCHLPRQPGEVRGRLPPSRSLERGRCGGEQAGHQNTAGASQPPAGGKLSELSTGIGEAFTRIRSMTAPDIWKNIPSKSDVYCVQKGPFTSTLNVKYSKEPRVGVVPLSLFLPPPLDERLPGDSSSSW